MRIYCTFCLGVAPSNECICKNEYYKEIVFKSDKDHVYAMSLSFGSLRKVYGQTQ